MYKQKYKESAKVYALAPIKKFKIGDVILERDDRIRMRAGEKIIEGVFVGLDEGGTFYLLTSERSCCITDVEDIKKAHTAGLK